MSRRHPLLHAFPLAVMTLALVLILFAFAMAELNRGTDPDLRAGTSAAIPGQALSTSR